MPEAVALGADVSLRAGQELTDLLEGEPKRLGPLDELKSANCVPSVDPVPSLGSGRRPQQAGLLVVAKSRGGNPSQVGQLADSHRRFRHVPDGTPSSELEGQAPSVPSAEGGHLPCPWRGSKWKS